MDKQGEYSIPTLCRAKHLGLLLYISLKVYCICWVPHYFPLHIQATFSIFLVKMAMISLYQLEQVRSSLLIYFNK